MFMFNCSYDYKNQIPVKTRAVLVFATERTNNVDPCLRSQTNVD